MTAPMNVGTLVGYLTLDDTGVDKGVRGATAKIQGFAKTGAAEGSKAGTAIGKSAGDKTVEAFGKSEGALASKARSVFGSVGRVAVGVLGGLSIASVLTKGWDRLTGIENAQAKLRGLGHDGEAVQAIMANALASVKGTAFGLGEAATTAAGAVAAGIKPGQELETMLKAVANSAAAAGVGLDEMGGIFNKVASLGKAQNDVLQQVANQGLPIYQKLAEQFGVTADEVFKMATRSEIGFAQFEAAMKSAAGTVADEMGQTTTGALSNLSAAAGRFGAKILEDVAPIVRDFATSAIDAFDAAGTALGGLINVFAGLPAPVKATVVGITALHVLAKAGVWAKLGGYLDSVADGLGRIKTDGLAASGVLKSIGKAAGYGAISVGIWAVVDALKGYSDQLIAVNDLVDENTLLLKDNSREMLRQQFAPYLASLNKAGIALDDLIEAMVSSPDAAFEMARAIEGNADIAQRGLRKILHINNTDVNVADLVREQTNALTDYRNALLEQDKLAHRSSPTFFEDEFGAMNAVPEAYLRAAEAAKMFGDAQDESRGASVANAEALRVLGAAMSTAGSLQDESKTSALGMAAAWRQVGDYSKAGVDPVGAMSDAVSAFDKTASNASTSLKFLSIAIDELSGRNVNLEEAQIAVRDTMAKLGDQTKEVTKLGHENASAILASGQALDTSNKFIVQQYSELQNAREAYDRVTSATYENAVANGEGEKALKKARAAAREARAAFVGQMATVLGNRDAAKALADQLGILEAKKLTDKDFRVDADTDGALSRLEALQRYKLDTKLLNVSVAVQDAQLRQLQTVGDKRVGQNAAGGAIDGPGPKGKDSVLSWLAPGEHVWTAAEVDRLGGQSAMYNLRRAVMGAPGFASGGSLTPPTAQALSGLAGPSLGPTLSGVTSALAQFAEMLVAVREAAKDAASKSKDADKALRQLTTSTNRDVKDRERNYARTRRDEDEAVQAAKERLAEAASKDIDAAEAALDKARRKRNERLGDLERTMNRANKADEKKLRQAEKAARLASQENAAAQQRSQAVANLVAATASLRTEQAGLAAELDTTNEALAGARSALDNLVQASQQMKDSISSGFLSGSAISQFASGVPVESMLAKLQQQLGMSQGISQSIMSLAGRGLNGTMLEDLARMGLSGAGLASALAGATDTQLQQFNSLQGQLKAAADATGTVVADAIYSNDIKIAERQVAALTAQTDRIEAALEKNATRMENLMSLAMQGLGTDVQTSADGAANKIVKAIGGLSSTVTTMSKTTTKGKGLSS